MFVNVYLSKFAHNFDYANKIFVLVFTRCNTRNYPDFFLHFFLSIKQSIMKLGRQHPKVAKLFEEKKDGRKRK